MAKRNYVDFFARDKVIGKLEEGFSVAQEFGIEKRVLSRAQEVFQATSTAVRKVDDDRPRKITAIDD